MIGERLPDVAAAGLPAAGSQEAPLGNVGVDANPAVHEFLTRLSQRHRVREREVAAVQRDVRDGKLADPLGPAFEVVGRSLAQHPDLLFADLVARVMDRGLAMLETATCKEVTPAEARSLLLGSLFDDHVSPLVRAALDMGRLRHATSVSRVISARERSGRSADVNAAAFAVSQGLARALVDVRAAGPLCSVIEDIGTMAVVVGTMTGDLAGHRFNETCRGLGELGQRIPRAFNPPGEPEITIGPHAPDLERSVPLGTLLNATWEIKEALFETAGDGPSPSIWVDAVKVTAREVVRYSVSVLRSNRLEPALFGAIDQLADVGTAGARAGDEKWPMFAGYALAELARDAEDAMWREYPTYLAMRLAEIAVWALDRDIPVRVIGHKSLGEKLALDIVAGLPSAIGYVVEQVRNGRFDEASDDANERLLAALGRSE